VSSFDGAPCGSPRVEVGLVVFPKRRDAGQVNAKVGGIGHGSLCLELSGSALAPDLRKVPGQGEVPSAASPVGVPRWPRSSD
jgi:hypothetical protein